MECDSGNIVIEQGVRREIRNRERAKRRNKGEGGLGRELLMVKRMRDSGAVRIGGV
jgi:hypothetical protein